MMMDNSCKSRGQDNIKLRPLLDMLLNNPSIKQTQWKPIVLQWFETAATTIADNDNDNDNDDNNNNNVTNSKQNNICNNKYADSNNNLNDVYDAYFHYT